MPINSFLYPGAKTTPAYEVANSVRYNDGDSPKMERTTSAGSNTTGTFSCWVKRGVLGTDQAIFTSTNDTVWFKIWFHNEDYLRIDRFTGSAFTLLKITDKKFRDPSSWYHIHIALDTTNGTAEDRMILTVNGTRVTSFASSTNSGSSDDLIIGTNTYKHRIGANQTSGDFFDGYLTEVVWIDGTALAVTNFGEFDSDSPTIWKPKNVSGLTFGTNGFYLDFEDSSALGNDVSGNDNDFTPTNLAATDQSTDTCTNNFCTLNPLGGKRGNNTTFSEGNLKSVDTGSTNGVDPNLHATFGLTAGSWYFEMKAEAITAGRMASIALLVQDGQAPDDYADARTVNLYYEKNSSGNKIRKFSSDVETGLADNAADDIFGVALDIDNGTVQFYKNGSTYGSQVTGLSSSGKTTFISMFGEGGSGRAATCNLNFGSPAFAISSGNADGNGYGNFEYSVPSGYYSLCTKNLAEFG